MTAVREHRFPLHEFPVLMWKQSHQYFTALKKKVPDEGKLKGGCLRGSLDKMGEAHQGSNHHELPFLAFGVHLVVC